MARKKSTTAAPLCLTGSLDIRQATTQHTLLRERLALAKPGAIDLSQIERCDTAGLQLLCAARASEVAAGREWKVSKSSEAVRGACAEIGLNPELLGL